ncbi:hypothetical protein H4P12_10910 [Paracoccus sp. 11-3]|uniref:Uncharacterized protein n=1 Tax=Paracoccus amoyensis TaxID=2760093 RepID=A0A926JBK9_9RHOB|nr:hypothetical protein [Paracoccus amoyensis]MBC9247211.1 hypothetical protein [Paracoccus amoyensis]
MLKIQAADEAIWHFAGIFQITEERGRMWIEYDRLTPVKPDIEPPEIKPLDIATQHPYVIPDYIPDIRYDPPGLPIRELQAAQMTFYDSAIAGDAFGIPMRQIGKVQPDGSPLILLTTPPPKPPVVDPPEPPPETVWTLPPPGSLVVMLLGNLAQFDDDRIDASQMEAGAVSLNLIDAKMAVLATQANELGIALNPDLPADELAFRDIALAFKDTDLPAMTANSATVHSLQGASVEGQFLNGTAVEEAPKLADLLPLYRKDQKAAQEEEAARIAKEEAAKTNDDGPSWAGSKTTVQTEVADNQHEFVHGNNTLLNEVVISSGWIAAPVMSVGQGIYNYNIISQTNVWSDQNVIKMLSENSGGAQSSDTTNALNYASYKIFSNPMPDRDGGDDAPQYWATATLKGSLINVNWVDQYNLMTDNDVTSITVNAAKTLMLMGENGTVNKVSLSELGTQFDLIVIDGYIINLNAVIQKNVLLDDDRIIVKGGTEAAVSAGDNLLINSSQIIQAGKPTYKDMTADMAKMMAKAAGGEIDLPKSLLENPTFQGLDLVRVLHIKGDMVSLNMIRQTNVMGDSDQIEIFRDKLLDNGGEIKIVAGSNVLVNSASIIEAEYDSTIYSGGQVYSDALLYQAELIATDDPLKPDVPSTLATEAVLFLADGMLSVDPEHQEFQPIGSNETVSPDAMETVLT